MKSILSGFATIVVALFVASFILPKGNQSQRSQHFTKSEINHGAYLVMAGACNDCHSPKLMTPNGPVPDPNKLLSGAPANEKVPEVPQGAFAPGKWGAIADQNFTTWAGPWGISFAANLTPDSATGIGGWTEQMFVEALRNGKYWGNGRPLLPPMPWETIGKMSNNDLRDMFAYLKSLKPVHNMVHNPVPPGN